jgi:hypothetical protein
MVIMKKIIIILFISIFYTIESDVFGQSENDSLLLSLRRELFPFQEDTTTVKISTLCEKEEIENDYTTYARQPDFKSIVNVLRKIAFTKDVSLISNMDRIRQEYAAYLHKEWEPLFNLKYGDCRVVNEKIQIFQCIEETLLSLNLKKMKLSKQESFDFYVDVQRRWYESANDNNNGYRAFEEFKEFSPYYLHLMKNRIGGVPVLNFDFIEPYLRDLNEPLIEYLNNYYVEGLKVQKLELEGYIFFRVLNDIDEEKNPILLNKLVNILFTNKYIDKIEISRNIITILKSSQPNGLLEKKIIEQLYRPKGEYKINALLASSYIFRPDFVDILINVNNAKILTDEENEYLKRVFDVLSKRPYISDTQRENLKLFLKE